MSPVGTRRALTGEGGRGGGSSRQELCRVLGVMNESTEHVWVGPQAEEANVTQDEQTGNYVC